jgi:hypothetical protein
MLLIILMVLGQPINAEPVTNIEGATLLTVEQASPLFLSYLQALGLRTDAPLHAELVKSILDNGYDEQIIGEVLLYGDSYKVTWKTSVGGVLISKNDQPPVALSRFTDEDGRLAFEGIISARTFAGWLDVEVNDILFQIVDSETGNGLRLLGPLPANPGDPSVPLSLSPVATRAYCLCGRTPNECESMDDCQNLQSCTANGVNQRCLKANLPNPPTPPPPPDDDDTCLSTAPVAQAPLLLSMWLVGGYWRWRSRQPRTRR